MAGQVGVPPGTTTVQMGGQTFAFGNWADDKLYGSGEFHSGQTDEEQLLVGGRSEPIPGGTRKQNKFDTNVPKGGLNGLPQDWEVYAFVFALQITRVMRGPTANPDNAIFPDTGGAFSDPPRLRPAWFDIGRKMYVEFQYNETRWTQGDCLDYPQGKGYSVQSVGSNVEIAQNSRPTPRDRVALVLPVWMRSGLGYLATFAPQAALTIDQAASDNSSEHLDMVDIKFVIYGLLKKVVVGA